MPSVACSTKRKEIASINVSFTVREVYPREIARFGHSETTNSQRSVFDVLFVCVQADIEP